MRFLILISVFLLSVVAGLAQELPSPAAAVPIRVATDRPKEPVAPKLAIDCPLPLRKLLRGGGGGGHSGGGHMGGGGGHMEGGGGHMGGGGGRTGGGGGGFHSSGGGLHTGSSTRSFSNPSINHPVVTHSARNNNNHQHHNDNHFRNLGINHVVHPGFTHNAHNHDDHQHHNDKHFSNPGINHPVVTHNHNSNNNHQHHDDNHNHDQHNRGNFGGLWWFGGPTYVNNGGWNSGVNEQQYCEEGYHWWCTPVGCECTPDDDDFLGRKLLATSAAAAGTDETSIESTAPEYLPADPGRSTRLRVKPYRRRAACKEGQPCRQATRSYRIMVHPAPQ